MYNLKKNDTNELIYKTESDPQTYGYKKLLSFIRSHLFIFAFISITLGGES